MNIAKLDRFKQYFLEKDSAAGGVIILILLCGILFLFILPGGCGKDHRLVVDGVLDTDQSDVSSKIPGRLTEIMVQEGDAVKAGQLLAILDSTELVAKKEQAQAGLEAAIIQGAQAEIALALEREKTQSQIEQAQAAVEGTKAAIGMAEAKLDALTNGARAQEKEQAQQAADAAQAAHETSEKTYTRIANLARDGVVAEQKADEVELTYKSAKANYEAAKAKLSLVLEGARTEEVQAARKQVQELTARLQAAESNLRLAQAGEKMISVREADVRMAKQKIAASRGALDEVNAYLNETNIVSPIDGNVVAVISNKGEMVAAGYSIFTIAKVDNYWVDVYLDESQWARRKVGDSVMVEIPSMGGSVPGKILKLLAAADFATRKANNELGSFDVRSVQLRIRLDDEVQNLARGLTARVHFDEKGAKSK